MIVRRVSRLTRWVVRSVTFDWMMKPPRAETVSFTNACWAACRLVVAIRNCTPVPDCELCWDEPLLLCCCELAVGSPAPSPRAFMVRAWVPITGSRGAAAGTIGAKRAELRRVVLTAVAALVAEVTAIERRLEGAGVLLICEGIVGSSGGVLARLEGLSSEGRVSVRSGWDESVLREDAALKSLRLRGAVLEVTSEESVEVERVSARDLNLMDFSDDLDALR